MAISKTGALRQEEARALEKVDRHGRISMQLYRQGVYSEPDFVLHGVLLRLVILGRLVYRGRTGDHRNVAYHYALPGASTRAAA